MNKRRFLLKTGPHAGAVFDGQGCNARPHPDAEPDYAVYRDGIYIPDLNLRLEEIRLPAHQMKHGRDFLHYEDLVVPFDRYGLEIFEGDTLYASVAKEVVVVKVLNLGDMHHHGCGWYERALMVINVDSGKKLTLKIPSSTIKKS